MTTSAEPFPSSVFRPKPKAMGPGLLLIALLDLLLFVLLAVVPHATSAAWIAWLIVAAGIPTYTFLYFRVSCLTVTGQGLEFRNFLGLTRRIARERFGTIDTRGGGRGPARYAFLDSNRRQIFSLNSKAWSSDDIFELARVMRDGASPQALGRK